MRLLRWIGGGLVLAEFAALLYLEWKHPLRKRVEPIIRHNLRNFALASVTALTVQAAEGRMIRALASTVERRRWGLLQRFRLPVWLEVPLGVAAMDYSIYVWHWLNHRVPLLWRFHLIHHVDLDLDTTTGIRFHMGELIASTGWRASQVTLLGIAPLTLQVWQTAFLLSVLFHHSGVRLPAGLERRLVALLVTPRMHGIHHSVIREETDSNFSSGLTIWDRLHGTLRLNVPQQAITIGVAAYRDPSEVTFGKVLALPLRKQRDDWTLPGGSKPVRDAIPAVPAGQLLA